MQTKTPKKTEKTYRYRAKNQKGNLVRGTITAQNPALAKVMLTKQGFYQVQLKPIQKNLAQWHRPIAQKQILLTFRTLATLVKSGIVLTQALGIAARSSTDAHLTQSLSQLKTDIESGQSLTQAMKSHPRVFNQLILSLVDVGEQSGKLDQMLEELADHYEQQLQLTAKINQALRYPALVVVVAIIVMAVLLIKVVPTFAQTFAAMGSQLPLPTQMVVAMSDFLVANFWWLGLGFLGGLGSIYLILYRSQNLRHRLLALTLKLPVIGPLLIAGACASFAKTLAITLEAGLALTDALDLSTKSTNNPVFIQAGSHIKRQVQAGFRLQEAIMDVGLFSLMSVQMIGVGEESGKLVDMLQKVAQYHQQEVQTKTETLVQMLEPTIMIVLGILVGGLVIAMYLPILSIGADL